jgi:hypothetical protein
MSPVNGNFSVVADGKNVGSVHIEQNGLMTVFNCACSYKSNDVLRLAAVCGGHYVPLGVMAPDAGVLRLKKSYSKNALISVGYNDPTAYHLIRAGEVYTGAPASAPENNETASEEVVYNDFPDPTDYYYEPEPEAEPVPRASEAVPQTAQVNPSGKMPNAEGGWVHIANPCVLFSDLGAQESCEGVSNALTMERDGYVLLAVPVSPNEPFPMMPVFCFGSSGEVSGQDCVIFKIRNGNLTL